MVVAFISPKLQKARETDAKHLEKQKRRVLVVVVASEDVGMD